jgi:hypothetical protein
MQYFALFDEAPTADLTSIRVQEYLPVEDRKGK